MSAPYETVVQPVAKAGATALLTFGKEITAIVATLGKDVPLAGTVCATFLAFEELVETAKSNKEDLDTLLELCDAVVKTTMRERCSEYSAGLEEALLTLEKHLAAAKDVARLCNGRVKQFIMGRQIAKDIAAVRQNVVDFSATINVALSHGLHAKLDAMAARLADQDKASRVEVTGAPRIQGWYVEREHITSIACDRLGVGSTHDVSEEPRMVGLGGPGGAGKSTVASMMIVRADVQQTFRKGVLWLPVGQGASNRLSALMFKLAEMVHQIVMKKTCRAPRKANVQINTEDGAAYIREVVKESRCFLVVADDVWEVEVLDELKRAGVWVLYTTRQETLLPEAPPLRLDQVLKEEAEVVLRRAAELDDDKQRLPDAAYELMRRCEYAVLDLVFLGRWGEVRFRSDNPPWQAALDRILEAQEDGEDEKALSWRAAVLRAGLKELANDNAQNKELYLALAIVPTGLAFPSEVGAFLLYGKDFSPEDLKATEKVLETLERWSIVTLDVNGEYRVHEDHVDFVWECLLANRDTQARVLPRWRDYISSLQALTIYSSGWLVKIWSVLANVEGGKVVPSPYDPVLDAMDLSNPELPKALKKAAKFHYERQDWPDAYDKYSRLRKIKEGTSGRDSIVMANILHSLGMCANEMVGREEETERLLRRALEIQKEKLGPNDPAVANTLHSLGVCVREAGETGEAEQLLRQALFVRQGKGDDPLSLARIQYSLGVCLYKTGRLKEAEEQLLKEALAIRKKWLGHDHPEVANALYYLGLCDHKAGRTGEGEKKLQRALEIFEQKMGKDHQDVADTLFSLGKCALEGGERTTEAEAYYRRALAIREKKEAANQVKVAHTLDALGVCALKTGKTKEAADYHRRANGLVKEQSVTAFRYEAVVYGGIEKSQDSIEGNKPRKASDFMESTTKFMHSKKDNEGTDFGEVLEEAVNVGHAEEDLRHLLSKLAVGTTMSSGSVQYKGVFSSLSTEDFEYAKVLRLTIMLRGTAKLSPDGDRLSVFVSPVLVTPVPPVASAESPGSIVCGNSEGEPVRFYMRITCEEKKGIMRRVGALAEENDVSIQAMLHTHMDTIKADFVVTTHPCTQPQVDRVSDSIGTEEWANGVVPLVMPLLPYSSREGGFSDAGAVTSPTELTCPKCSQPVECQRCSKH